MKLRIRYEDTIQEIEVEAEEMIVSLNIVVEEGMSEEAIEKLINREFDEQMNRPEYNSFHKYSRHLKTVNHGKEKDTAINLDELCPEDVKNKDLFSTTENEVIENMEREELWKQVRSLLTDEQFDMLVAIAVERLSIKEYAKNTGKSENAVSHTYCRVKKKLRENKKLSKMVSDFGF